MISKDYHYMSSYMNIALNISRSNLGNTMPNPTVGCVIVNNDKIVGRGCTAVGGRPHAEHIALEMAGNLAQGATMYVTLEPCAHHGTTPPCIDALVEAGIKKVVIAVKDPDSRVNGVAIQALKDAGVTVAYGVCYGAAKFLNIGHFYNKLYNRPFVTLKIATTMDGKIATHNFNSKWITGGISRDFAHKMRSINDAILVGSNTIVRDNPMLNCRLPGLEDTSPIKIILAGKDNLSSDLNVFKSGETWIFGAKSSIANGESIKNAIMDEHSSIKDILSILAEKGITRLMVEGGQNVITQFVKEGFLDQIMWFRSNAIGGNDSLSAIGDLNISDVKDFPCFSKIESYKLGGDTLDVLLKPRDVKFDQSEDEEGKVDISGEDRNEGAFIEEDDVENIAKIGDE